MNTAGPDLSQVEGSNLPKEPLINFADFGATIDGNKARWKIEHNHLNDVKTEIVVEFVDPAEPKDMDEVETDEKGMITEDLEKFKNVFEFEVRSGEHDVTVHGERVGSHSVLASLIDMAALFGFDDEFGGSVDKQKAHEIFEDFVDSVSEENLKKAAELSTREDD